MKNLRISTRLSALIGLLGVLLLSIGSIGLYGISTANAALKTVYEDRTIPIGQLGDIQSLLLSNRLAIAVSLVTPTPDVIQSSLSSIDTNLAAISKIWSAYTATAMTEDEKRLVQQFQAHRDTYLQEALRPTMAALKGHDITQAQSLVLGKLRPLAEPVLKDLQSLRSLQVDHAKIEFNNAAEHYATIRLISISSIVLGLAGAIAFGMFISRSVTRPIHEAVQLAKAVASGDLTSRIHVASKDETGQLLAALKAMNDSLVSIVSNVRHSSDSIATGSAQIATGNADLSQRTEEQASNLQQTAASMEQLTSTVKQNSDTARQANQLASGASQAAAKGGEVVGQVVGTMEQITASSKKINDIISVIDGIAFQTNILALNAAVEAARAGEQGRGFAVVASEVRSLAQRSAQAAKEIKTLISESVEKVEAGSALVDEAGKSMQEIVNQVARVTDLIAEISAASVEQTQGIGQVGDAVNQLDQVTQQNAALVEESAAAAESLRHQAANLAQVVGVFRLSPA
ncbi:MAG TPA: methyl-accepting chemotaxis protein [Aquabacterium sp.]|uniref:methyl-accepting chemotaxis protein n=1 Tax=Aquabacterium sp. TaxID=1872578 RepID=UPI002E2F8563|nr:methyl-accepting chemotaxis protein [Aquabacterium sp.]HEX5372910.1 methyl-accepting chemotaxis protein [Aquabacterium sp.]